MEGPRGETAVGFGAVLDQEAHLGQEIQGEAGRWAERAQLDPVHRRSMEQWQQSLPDQRAVQRQR